MASSGPCPASAALSGMLPILSRTLLRRVTMGWILFRSLDRAWKEEMRSFTRRVTLVTLSATQVLI